MPPLQLKELDNEQRRQLIDAKQLYGAWRQASRKKVPGSYRWVTRKGHDYLYRKYKNSERSLGRRSPETESLMREQMEQRERLKVMGERLKVMARVNRALFLNRVPKDASLVLRELDAAGLLGKHLFVIGTNALYAYEMRSGVLFESALLATQDFDLLWDARDRLRLLVSEMSPDGVLGILRRADPSFSSADDYGTRAQNASGYFVDLFCPDIDPAPDRLTPTDIDPIPIEGSNWLVRAPKFEETVIGWDGMPMQMHCIDPRVFALHKMWLSRQASRQQTSRARDIAQANAVAAVATGFMQLSFDDPALARLPKALKTFASELKAASEELLTQ
jgi:hypothetical protein